MSDSNKRLAMGLSDIRSVIAYYANVPGYDSNQASHMISLESALRVLSDPPVFRQSAIAIVASYLNQRFKETGEVWWSDDQGELQRKYISSGPDREMFALLLGVE